MNTKEPKFFLLLIELLTTNLKKKKVVPVIFLFGILLFSTTYIETTIDYVNPVLLNIDNTDNNTNHSLDNKSEDYPSQKIQFKEEMSENNPSLIFSTFFGNNDSTFESRSRVISSLSDGSIVLVGKTGAGYIVKNGYDESYNGQLDIFLTKLDSNGSIIWSTYFGGQKSDEPVVLTINNNDDIVLAGFTTSIDFPVKNAYRNTLIGEKNLFVSKFSSNGSLIWSTYFGGSSLEKIYDLLIDKNNNILLIGDTTSIDFPVKNAYSDTNNGYTDIFISKFASNGSLLWSTYFGGSFSDSHVTANIDLDGNIVMSGGTFSDNFPVKDAFNSSYSGLSDLFIAKIDNNNGSLLWSTYFGGNDFDFSSDVKIDTKNNIIIVGVTYSTNFPTKNAFNSTYGGNKDGFITKFNPNGSLLWSTYIGGNASDILKNIIISLNGTIIVGGMTSSTNFPIKNAYFNTSNFNTSKFIDVVILSLTENGSLVWSTYLGGNSSDLYSMLIYNEERIIITGVTISSNFPLKNSLDNQFMGDEMYVAQFTLQGELEWSTFLGGNSYDRLESSTINKNGDIILTGETSSNDFPIKNPYIEVIQGNENLFVSIISKNASLRYSTYLGPSKGDTVYYTETDSNDNIIIAGETSSISFPVKNASFNNFKGRVDCFIAKFTSNGSLLWSTYLGGNQDDRISDIVIDSNDNIIIAGETNSADFPLVNPIQTELKEQHSSFITKFSPDGKVLWSTYLGEGSLNQFIFQVKLDSNDNIILVGATDSQTIPIKNAYLSRIMGDIDGFILKFSPGGELLWGTYLGGIDFDRIECMTIDSKDNVIVAGHTFSEDFPVVNSLSLFNKIVDGFITKFNPNGRIAWSNIIGGENIDYIRQIDIDRNGNIGFVGVTQSTNLPTKNAFMGVIGGETDIFAGKFSADGILLWSTYLGGKSYENRGQMKIDTEGNMIITGITYSQNFPLKNSLLNTFSGQYDIFVAKFSNNGQLSWSTYLGGNASDLLLDFCLDSHGNIILTGITDSTNFPLKNPYQKEKSRETDMFVTAFLPNGRLTMSTYFGGKMIDISFQITTDKENNIIIVGGTFSSDFPTKNAYDTKNIGMDGFIIKLLAIEGSFDLDIFETLQHFIEKYWIQFVFVGITIVIALPVYYYNNKKLPKN